MASAQVIRSNSCTFTHDGIRPFIAMSLHLRTALHGHVTDQTKEQGIHKVGERPNHCGVDSARSTIFLHNNHAKSQLTQRAAVHALADDFVSDATQEREDKYCNASVSHPLG